MEGEREREKKIFSDKKHFDKASVELFSHDFRSG
jgi:hypothetical protein